MLISPTGRYQLFYKTIKEVGLRLCRSGSCIMIPTKYLVNIVIEKSYIFGPGRVPNRRFGTWPGIHDLHCTWKVRDGIRAIYRDGFSAKEHRFYLRLHGASKTAGLRKSFISVMVPPTHACTPLWRPSSSKVKSLYFGISKQLLMSFFVGRKPPCCPGVL